MDPQIGGLDRPILWPIWYSAFECCLIIFLSYSLEKDIFTTCTGNKDWTWTFPRTDNDIDDSRLGSYFFRWKSIKIKSRLLQHGETNNTVKQTSDVSDLHQPLSLRFRFLSRPNPMKILVKPINICPNSVSQFFQGNFAGNVYVWEEENMDKPWFHS